MNSWSRILMLFVACSIVWSSDAMKPGNLPRLPGAMLLVGYPPNRLVLTTQDKTWAVQEDGRDWYLTPSISSDGRLIGSARIASGDFNAPRPRMVIATYSTEAKKWTEYKSFETFGGSVAISPDGSKVAFLMRNMPDRPSHLMVLDLATNNTTVGPFIPEYAGTDMSWSPDGRRLAFDLRNENTVEKGAPILHQGIFLFDVETRNVSRLTDGASPAWAPSGEWIAFLDNSPESQPPNTNRVRLIRPSGQDSRVLATFHRGDMLATAPVWSPDSKTILIGKFKVDLTVKASVDIFLLNLDTLNLVRKFKNVPPIFGWVQSK